MKNRIIYILMVLAVVLASCGEGFSETKEIGTLNPGSLQNADGVNFLLTAAYSNLDGVSNASGGWEATGDNWWMDAISDDAHKGSTDGDQQTLFLLETFDWTTGNSYLGTKWRALYAGVNRANAVISVISQIEDGDFSAQLAEARFLRGHYYFELQKVYGYVAYINEQHFDNVEFNQPNTGDVWAEIEADFDFAANNLPATGDVGRATSWAAKAYLAKAHLFQGKWGTALSTFNDVINNGPYALNTEYVDNFKLGGESGPEAIFVINFDVAGGAFAPNGNVGGTLNFGGPNGWCCGFYQPSIDLVNAFQTSNGLPLLDTYNQTDVTNDYGMESSEAFTPHTGPLDPRLDYTAGRRGIDYNGWDVHPGKDWIRSGFSDISGPYSPKKNVYHAGEDGNQGAGNWGQQHSGINYHFIRYADVLLMAAEAAVESNDMGTALTYVNEVRKRAKNSTTVKDASGADAANYAIEEYTTLGGQDNARKAVRHERRLELGMEGHRLFDIRRWSNGVQIMNNYIANEARTIGNFGTKAKAYESKHNLFPIPIGAIDQSRGSLTQNPDW